MWRVNLQGVFQGCAPTERDPSIVVDAWESFPGAVRCVLTAVLAQDSTRCPLRNLAAFWGGL